jgi:hypothetical protein
MEASSQHHGPSALFPRKNHGSQWGECSTSQPARSRRVFNIMAHPLQASVQHHSPPAPGECSTSWPARSRRVFNIMARPLQASVQHHGPPAPKTLFYVTLSSWSSKDFLYVNGRSFWLYYSNNIHLGHYMHCTTCGKSVILPLRTYEP